MKPLDAFILQKLLSPFTGDSGGASSPARNGDTGDTDYAPLADGGLRQLLAAIKSQDNPTPDRNMTYDNGRMASGDQMGVDRFGGGLDNQYVADKLNTMRANPQSFPPPSRPTPQQDAQVKLQHLMNMLPVVHAASSPMTESSANYKDDIGTPWLDNPAPMPTADIKRDMRQFSHPNGAGTGSGIAALLNLLGA